MKLRILPPFMAPNPRLGLAAGCVMLILAGLPSAEASNQTWNGGSLTDGNWSDTSNWAGGAAPGSPSGTTSTDIAIFNTAIVNTWGANAGNAVVIDQTTQNIGGINFDTSAGNYFIGSTGSNSLLLTAGGTTQILSTLQSTNAVETINAPLVIEGAGGTYTFANNSANGAGAGAGTLDFGGGITGGAAGASVLTLAGTNTNANTISGAIGNGSATTMAVTETGAGIWVLSGANTYTGATTINAGTLSINSIGSTGGATPNSLGEPSTTGTVSTINIAGDLQYTGGTATTGSSNRPINLTNSSTIDASGSVPFILTGAITMPGNSYQLVLTGTGVGMLSGKVGTSASIAPQTISKNGSGTWILSSGNIYDAGKTKILGGTLEYANVGSLYANSTGKWTAVNISVTNGATMAFNVLAFGSGGLATVYSNLVTSASSGYGFQGGSILGLDTTGTNYVYSTAIANSPVGSLGLTKLGTNSLTLSASNSYTGATTVKAGTLIVTGSISGSTVTVGDSLNPTTSAMLAGTGSVGNVILGAGAGNTGAIVEPNGGVSETVVGSGTTLNTGAFTIAASSGATLALQVGRLTSGTTYASDGSDHIVTTGSVSLNGNLAFSLQGTYTPTVNDLLFLIIDGGGTAVGGQFATVNGATLTNSTFVYNNFQWEIFYTATAAGALTGGNDVVVEGLGAVPEPGTWGMIFGGFGLLLGVQKLRKPQVGT